MPDTVRIERPLRNAQATAALATDLAAALRAGDGVELHGEMGAGKTTLVRTLAHALGLDQKPVSSPTFVIVQSYSEPRLDEEGDPVREPPTLVHADFYRLGGADELDTLGWDRLTGPDTIVVAEWPDRAPGALAEQPNGVCRVALEITGESSRLAHVECPAAWSARVGFDALRAREDTTCPVTGRPVPGDSPTWPFVDDRTRMAELHRWFSESYRVSRAAQDTDLELGD